MKTKICSLALALLSVSAMAGATSDVPPGVDLAEECQDPVRRLELKYIYGIECPEEPVPGEEKKARFRVDIRTAVPKKYFVGDEPVQVRYDILIPYDARIGEINFAEHVKPFELIALREGRRVSVPEANDFELQRTTLTVRLPVEYDLGTYSIPSLNITYERAIPAESGMEAEKGVAKTDTVELQKVPLYVDVVQDHNVGFIGDVFTFSMEIHAENNAIVMNEYPPDESREAEAYLSEYQPELPWVLLDSGRQEYREEHYHIIRWRYTVSPHTIGREALELPVPQVVWRLNEKRRQDIPLAESDREARIIAPDPILVRVRSITESGDSLKPLKKVHPEPAAERTWLMIVPRLTMWALFTGALILAFAYGIQLLRAGRKRAARAPFTEMIEKPKVHYDRWPHQRFLVKRHAKKARETFQKNPTMEGCITLRALLARKAVMHLGRETRVPIEEACAMTASEIERLVGKAPETDDIRELDDQLETGLFTRLIWKRERKR